jgi:hypothetical protein
MSVERFLKSSTKDDLRKWVDWHKNLGYGDDVPMEFTDEVPEDPRDPVTRHRFKLSEAEAVLSNG